MMINLLAEVTASDGLSGEMVIKIIGAIFSGVVLILGGRHLGRKESADAREVTLKKPVPTVVTRQEPLWATRPDLDDHIEQTRSEFARVWDQFGVERKIGGAEFDKIHERLNRQSEATSALQGTVNEVKASVRQLLDIALNRKTGTRP